MQKDNEVANRCLYITTYDSSNTTLCKNKE